MNRWMKWGSAVFFLILFSSSYGLADTVTSVNPIWQLLPGSSSTNGGTWGLPSSIPGCGSENEPTCEPTGDFIINKPFTTPAGYYIITEAPTVGTDDGVVVSDLIVWSNSAPGGNGEIRFFSDPNLPVASGIGVVVYVDHGILCTENVVSGCIGTFHLTTTDSTDITVKAASDGESAFDPFGFGVDTSDQIQFSGATPTSTPEPSSLLLLGTGILGLGGMWRRRLSL
jgi:hypothetical protein